ncbi:hypothetical protein DFJ73DRAFT_452744 [Zopfochytrium polystomum]|nr:hypothetical protein DFJ73DRAFT_452744 [Zopfochytrium polystomum]
MPGDRSLAVTAARGACSSSIRANAPAPHARSCARIATAAAAALLLLVLALLASSSSSSSSCGRSAASARVSASRANGWVTRGAHAWYSCCEAAAVHSSTATPFVLLLLFLPAAPPPSWPPASPPAVVVDNFVLVIWRVSLVRAERQSEKKEKRKRAIVPRSFFASGNAIAVGWVVRLWLLHAAAGEVRTKCASEKKKKRTQKEQAAHNEMKRQTNRTKTTKKKKKKNKKTRQ